MFRRPATLATAVAGIALLVGACGSSSSGGSGGGGGGTNDSSAAPATELASAIQSLTGGSALTTTLGLETTAANLEKITGENDDTPLTASQAGLIAGAHITIEVTAPSGKTLATSKSGNAFALTGTSGGTTYFALRNTGGVLYLQVDLKDLLTAAGKAATYRGLLTRGASLPGFVQALFAGKWVSITGETINALEGAAAGVTPGGLPTGGDILHLGSTLRTDLLGDLTVNRTTTGGTDVLALSGNLRAIAKTFLDDLATGIPAAASSLHAVSPTQVPNKNLSATASVTGGALSKFEFDFGQFSPGQKDTLPIAATFAKSGPAITAPSGAIAVNSGELFQALASAGSGNS